MENSSSLESTWQSQQTLHALPKKQFGSHHVASTKAIWFGPGLSITISSTAILFTIGSSNPVSSTNKFELRFAHGWVVASKNHLNHSLRS